MTLTSCFMRVYQNTAQFALLLMAMPEVDEKRVGSLGASKGEGLTLVCLTLTSTLNRIAPVFPFLFC